MMNEGRRVNPERVRRAADALGTWNKSKAFRRFKDTSDWRTREYSEAFVAHVLDTSGYPADLERALDALRYIASGETMGERDCEMTARALLDDLTAETRETT